MKTLIKFAILIALSFLNLKYYPILLIFPFPFFGLVSGFILVSIWIYLFLYFGVFLIFRFFKIDKPINKTYLALAFPLFLALWIGVSFIPLEYQPSFRKFEELCKNQAGITIYDEKIYKLWDGWDGQQGFGKVIFDEKHTKIDWRILKIQASFDYIDHKNQRHKIKQVVGFFFKNINIFNTETIGCGYFENPKDQK